MPSTSRLLLLATALAMCMTRINGFVTPFPSASRFSAVRLFAELPDIEKMKAGEMKKELESYGIPTKAMLEKSEFIEALKKARAEGKKPLENKKSDDSKSTSSKAKSSKKKEEEPMDPSYRDVVTQKI
mmetsp:Transcript_67553/g.195306  ORF Transcript_67553/g.195306 Transcript_67553/m.195306 type:complete len:128 (+) Transcript_67553:246-629(+)